MIAFNFHELYKYLLNDIINTNNYSNIGEPHLSIITTELTITIANKIPLYISWGNLTPKLMHYMHKTPDSYLMNFGPCYYDELFRLNLLVKQLNGDTNFTNTTIFYLIKDGDFYNYALRFFYLYANDITIFNLLSTTYNESVILSDGETITLSANNIPAASNSQPGSKYNKYLNAIYQNRKTYSFDRGTIDNVNNRIDAFPHVVLINIPDAENADDKNEFALGKAFDKSFDIMKKHYNLMDANSQNLSYIYINTESTSGEQALINSLNNEINFLGIPDLNNKYFVDSSKVILSSYNNIEYNLKTVSGTKSEYMNRLNNLYVLSAYNLDVSNGAIANLSNFDVLKNLSEINLFTFENYEKNQSSINIDDYNENANENANILSYQKLNLGILEANLFNYLILLIIERKYSQSFKDTTTNQYHKISGEDLYTFYKTKIEMFFKYNLTNSVFENLLDDFINNNNVRPFGLPYYSIYYIYLADAMHQTVFNSYTNNSGFIYNGSRIRTFNLYQKNNNDFTKISHSQNVYTVYDNFEDAISSVFYEYILLRSTSVQMRPNQDIPYDLNNIIDIDNSVLINSSSFNDIIMNCPNVYLSFFDISSNISLKYIDQIDSVNNIVANANVGILGQDIKELLINITPGSESESGDFKIQLYIDNVKNIYNDDLAFKLYSNTIMVTIDAS